MKKLSEGKYQLFTTKEDAVHKFMQMQGVCREEISGENPIEFHCTKKGKIIITNPPTKRVESQHSTNLFAEITTQDGKTYVTYYTAFSKTNSVSKSISFILSIITAILAVILAVYTHKPVYLILFLLYLVFYVLKFSNSVKETKNSPKDSEILITELEKRVEAVNLWDK